MKEIWDQARRPKSWTLEKLGCHICSQLWQPAGASSPERRCKIISLGITGTLITWLPLFFNSLSLEKVLGVNGLHRGSCLCSKICL